MSLVPGAKIVEKGDWFAVVLAVLFCGVGLFLQSFSQRFARYAGLALIACGVIGATGWFGYFRTGADAQLPPSVNGNGNCINVGPSQGPQTNNCPTIIHPPPPHADNVLYQDERAVADFVSPTVNEATKTVTFSTVWNSESLDYQRPVCFRHYLLKITAADLAGRTLFGMAPNGQPGRNITPGMTGTIIGTC